MRSSNDLVVRLDCAAVRDVTALVDAAVLNVNRQNLSLLRPAVPYKGHARAWWVHAIACIRHDFRQRRSSYAEAAVMAAARDGKR